MLKGSFHSHGIVKPKSKSEIRNPCVQKPIGKSILYFLFSSGEPHDDQQSLQHDEEGQRHSWG